MKHVREQIPDVQLKRPEVSAALAAVVETATAKRLDERYADDAELIADLEDVLALETTRTGAVTGEVTSVLRTLPPQSRQRLPLRQRRPALAAVAVLVAIVVIVGGIVYLATRSHHTAPPASVRATQASPPHEITLCQACAHDYNPDAISGAKNQNPNLVGYAVDGDPGTAWMTEIYYQNTLGKPGVGLYVDAGKSVVAGTMSLTTQTPGYAATIYGRVSAPNPNTFDVGSGGWVKVGSVADVQGHQSIHLTGSAAYRYYLVWITSLGGRNQVAINEIKLYTP
jgi:serine/threonine-protein kinase